jgi:hypothetical protein
MDFDLAQKTDMTRFILVCSKLIRLLNEGDTFDVFWYSKHFYFLACRNNYLYTVSVCLLIIGIVIFILSFGLVESVLSNVLPYSDYFFIFWLYIYFLNLFIELNGTKRQRYFCYMRALKSEYVGVVSYWGLRSRDFSKIVYSQNYPWNSLKLPTKYMFCSISVYYEE